MGVTGSGKSSFISRYSGKVVKVGHQLEACKLETSGLMLEEARGVLTR
jgi:predicted GTPase